MKTMPSVPCPAPRIVLAALLLSTATFAQLPTRMIVFGDSLSDPGNLFAATGAVTLAPFAPIPDAPYAIGGHHFSNGPTWVEQLAVRIGHPASGGAASLAPGEFTNYAVGRARARAGAPGFPEHSLADQVDAFLADHGSVAPTDVTYVLWIGTNDARDALELGGDPTVVVDAVTAVATALGTLAAHGARDFIVLGVPDLGLVPAIAQLPAPIPTLATGLTTAFNAALSGALDAVAAVIAPVGGTIRYVDTATILGQLVATPTAFGLEEAVVPCLVFGSQGRFLNGPPPRYLFWDAAHPTTAGHGALCDAIAAALTP